MTTMPMPMDSKDRQKLRTAAFRITRVYPGPVGDLCARELLTWEEFGYRLGGAQLISRLVEHALTAPTADERAAAKAQPEAGVATNIA